MNEFIAWCFFLLLIISPFPLLFWILSHYSIKFSSKVAFYSIYFSIGWLAFQLLCGLILGLFSLLTYRFVLIFQLSIFVLGTALLISRGKKSFYFKMIAPENKYFSFGVFVLLFLSVSLIWIKCSATPITDFDSLYYHLPMMVNWFQNGNLTRLSEFGQISFYPYNWELICTLFIFPFHSEFQTRIPNLVAWLILGASVYGISRELKGSSQASTSASFFVLFLPLTLENIYSLHVDLPFAAFFMASLYFTLVSTKYKDVFSVNIALISVGVLLGLKMSAIGYVFIIALWYILFSIQGNKHSETANYSKIKFVSIFPGLLLCILFGGYWYFINIAEIHNPLGYMGIEFGKFEIFKDIDLDLYLNTTYPHFSDQKNFISHFYNNSSTFNEYVNKTTLASLFNIFNKNDWGNLKNALFEQGSISIVFFLTAFLVSVRILLDKNVTNRKEIILIIFTTVVLGLLYWHTPYSADNGSQSWKITPWIGQGLRYALPMLATGALIIAIGLTKFDKHQILSTSLIVVSILNLFTSRYKYFFGLLIFLFFYFICTFMPKFSIKYKANKKIFVAFLIILSFLLLVKIKSTEEIRVIHQGEKFNHVSTFIDINTNSEETIGYLLSFYQYPLYGTKLDRNVIFSPAFTENQGKWVSSLRKDNIRFVSIGPFRDEIWLTSLEYQWLNDPNGYFIKVFGDNPQTGYEIYKLK